MSQARQQHLTAIEAAVADSLDRRLDAIADELAERVVERIAATRNGTGEPAWIDAAEVARRYGCSRDYVYDHAKDLGAVRMGGGPKARLRFDPGRVAEALMPRPHPATAPELKRTRGRPRRQGSRPDLLPIHGSARDD